MASLVWLCPLGSAATPGDTDPSFNAGSISPSGESVVAVQPDGKVLIGGSFSSIAGTGRNMIARLNTDGSVDGTFQNGLAGANNAVFAIALQPNGQILIGGAFTMVNGTARNRIARLNSDGSLDGTFLNGLTGANSFVSCIAVQTNGQIIIGGDFTSVNGVTCNLIGRLNANGSLDTTFASNNGAGPNEDVATVALQNDGRILVGGAFTLVNGTTRNFIARLSTNGLVDNTFQNGMSGADFDVNAIVVQSDGKIIMGGAFSIVNGMANHNAIARLNTDGSLDGTFNVGNGAQGTYPYVYAVALQSNGQVLLGGTFTAINGYARNGIGRLNADGSVEDWFLYQLNGADGLVGSLGIQSDGKIMIGGSFGTVNTLGRSQVARLSAAYDSPRIANPGMSNGQFGFNPVGAPGQSLGVQASTDLVNWTQIGTVVLGNIGPPLFSDSQTGLFNMRYYRLTQ